jgi:hypothetical protein
MSTDDKRIREFAYQIWESEGKPEGQEERHWKMARTLAEAEALAPKKPAKAAASKSATGKAADQQGARTAKVSMARQPARQKPKPKPAAASAVLPPGRKTRREKTSRSTKTACGLTFSAVCR